MISKDLFVQIIWIVQKVLSALFRRKLIDRYVYKKVSDALCQYTVDRLKNWERES